MKGDPSASVQGWGEGWWRPHPIKWCVLNIKKPTDREMRLPDGKHRKKKHLYDDNKGMKASANPDPNKSLVNIQKKEKPKEIRGTKPRDHAYR